jgi:hypothetical protein
LKYFRLKEKRSGEMRRSREENLNEKIMEMSFAFFPADEVQ